MVARKIKYFLSLFFNYCLPILLNSQDHGVNWILGYGVKNDTSLFGRTILNFNGDSLNVIRNSGGFKFYLGFENNSYSDDQGVLRFFYDGFRIGNAIDYNKVENGDTLNPGIIWKTYNGAFYPISDASVFLPSPDNDSILYLFHKPIELYSGLPILYSPHLYLTKININANNGMGKVLFKNKAILDGNLSLIVMNSCKHSNGKDWWLICKNNQNSTYYSILLTSNESIKIDSQIIGTSQVDYSSVGNAIFSLDGKKFARISSNERIQIFDFDRCSGKLSNFTQIENDSLSNSFWVNTAISKNNRFLYASTSNKIYQYDLNAVDIQSSMEVIGQWDGFIYDNNFSTSFCDMQLAPNGKIYVSCASGNIYLHVINQPNLKGKNCDFQLRGITLPTYIACGLGNYPNYLLGADEGSICDTLTSNREYKLDDLFIIYPNPSNSKLQIKSKFPDYSKNSAIEIINISGNVVFRSELREYQKASDFDFGYLNPGLYFIQFYQNHKLIQSSKWILY